jgi:hypothetical protein
VRQRQPATRLAFRRMQISPNPVPDNRLHPNILSANLQPPERL